MGSLRTLASELEINLLKLRNFLITVGIYNVFEMSLNAKRRRRSKSLVWSCIILAFHRNRVVSEEVKRPKALKNIRGNSYIYPMPWRFGMIGAIETVERRMKQWERCTFTA